MSQVLPDGTEIAMEYDGLAKERSRVAALACNPDLVVLSEDEEGRVIESYPGRSKTRQSEKDSADINVIIKRMEGQGIGPILPQGEARFLDISEVSDYRSAVHQIRDARSYFMELDPIDRRDRFDNKVENFLDTVSDPVRLQQLIAEGIVVDGTIVGGPPVGGAGAGAPPSAAPEVK